MGKLSLAINPMTIPSLAKLSGNYLVDVNLFQRFNLIFIHRQVTGTFCYFLLLTINKIKYKCRVMTLYLTRGLQCVATEEVCVFINMTQDYYSENVRFV